MIRAACAIYRALLVSYPRAFRVRVADEMTATFAARVRAARRRGVIAATAMAGWLAADAIVDGLADRLRCAWNRWFWPRHSNGEYFTSHSGHSSHSIHSASWSSRMREMLTQDIRLALRHFRREPLFALITMATLALGIGANSAIFSVVRAVLLRPLPYADPARLVMIWSDNTHQHEAHNQVSPANFAAFRSDTQSFESVEALYSFLVTVPVNAGADVDVVAVSTVTPGLFQTLGRTALIGRTLTAADQNAAVLSYSYWQRRFGGDPSVLNKSLSRADGVPPATIVGVMPPDFVFPYVSMLSPSGFTRASTADMWMPLLPTSRQMVDASGQPTRQVHFLCVMARLKPGVDIRTATAEVSGIAARRAKEFPDSNEGWGVTVQPLHDRAVGSVRPALLLLLGGAGIVLLMTCVNVASVLLARSTSRQRDFAIRTALGASGRRLAAHSLIESVLLATGGGVLGVGLCWIGTRVLVQMAPNDLPRLGETAVDPLVLTFALLLAIVTGIAVGILPALGAARDKSSTALRETGRTTASPARKRVRATLVVTEVALAAALTVGAGLLLRSFVAVLQLDPGFASSGLLTFQMRVPAHLTTATATVPPVMQFYADLDAKLRALPGVTNVGGTTRLPLGSTNVSTALAVEGRDVPVAQLPEVELRRAVFDYFGAMQIPIVHGRNFNVTDAPGTPSAVIVNSALVARVFPNEDPIGRRVRMGPNPQSPWSTIVGVVGSIRHASLEESPKPEIYISYQQGPPINPFIVLRTSGDPARLATAVRDVVTSFGSPPPTDVRTMTDLRSEAMAKRRFVFVLVAAFGALALGLASLGVYGVTALVVSERTREVGVRLALGARPGQLFSAVIRDALRLGTIGLVIGLALGLGLAVLAASQLFGVSAIDPMTMAGAAAVLLGSAALAASGPARRAMRVDPISALRQS